MDDVAFTVAFVGINDPTPAMPCNSAAIASRPTSSTELVSDDFPVFHWRHDAIEQHRTTKEIGGSVLIYVLTLPFLKT